VGTVGPQEAEFSLLANVVAGPWLWVGDGIITRPVDVTFEILWRKAAGGDVAIATFQHHFDPLPSGFAAQAYEATAPGPAITFAAGDQVILRYSGATTDTPSAYIPNGDGFRANGRIPFIDLPE
jgi:hypothetical protein